MGQPKHRSRYPASRIVPPTDWVPPKSPCDTFFCFALRCGGLKAETCCQRQSMLIRGTPEPRYLICHPSCVQGRAVKRAMGRGYRPPRVWYGVKRRNKGKKAAPLSPPTPDPSRQIPDRLTVDPFGSVVIPE